MMFAPFHSKGTTPSFNEKLNTLASGTLICSTFSFSSLGEIYYPSLSFIVFMCTLSATFFKLSKQIDKTTSHVANVVHST